MDSTRGTSRYGIARVLCADVAVIEPETSKKRKPEPSEDGMADGFTDSVTLTFDDELALTVTDFGLIETDPALDCAVACDERTNFCDVELLFFTYTSLVTLYVLLSSAKPKLSAGSRTVPAEVLTESPSRTDEVATAAAGST